MLSQLRVGRSVNLLSTDTQPKVNTTRPSLDWHLNNIATDMLTEKISADTSIDTTCKTYDQDFLGV